MAWSGSASQMSSPTRFAHKGFVAYLERLLALPPVPKPRIVYVEGWRGFPYLKNFMGFLFFLVSSLFFVSWLLGFNVFRFLSFVVSGFKSFLVSWFQSFKDSPNSPFRFSERYWFHMSNYVLDGSPALFGIRRFQHFRNFGIRRFEIYTNNICSK